jgi:hypothetical protein
LWSLPDFAALTRHLATFARDRAVRRWSEYARAWRLDYRETLLVPSIWCVTHPDWTGGRSSVRRRLPAR